MNNCVSRYFAPIFLAYFGFILLGTLIGVIIGLIIDTILVPAIIIGFFIGLSHAIIANAIVLIIINKQCHNNYEIGC